jgi:murein DD-endopeptidase MepM/ murein hydrolase activator NlpD
MSDQVATHDTPAFHAGVRDALDEHLSGMSFGQPDHDGEPDWGAAGYAIRQQVPQPDLVWTHGGRSSVPVELGFTGLPGSAGTAGSPGTADSPGTVGSPGMGSTNWTIQSTSSPLAPTLDATPPPEVQRRTSGPDGLDQLTDSEIPGEQEATPVGWSAFEAGRETLVALAGRLRGLVRRHNQRFAAAAGVILLSGAAFIGLSGSASHSARDGDDALTPLAQAIEAVSRRNLAQLTSRSMTAQLVEAAQVDPVSSETEISADPRSNVGLVLTWDVSALEASPGAQLILRRGVGDAPPLTPAEGVDVALGDDPGVVQDLGLQPDTAYSYTLFIQRPGEKPEVLGRLVATTSRFPTELLPGQSLVAGERLTSATHTHYLAVDQTGAVVLYNNLNQKLWSLDADPDPSASLMLNGDGELIVAVGELVKWRADASAPGAQLVLADTGALQLIGADGEVVWTSHNAGYQLRGGDSPYAVSSDGWTQPGAGPVSSPFGMRSHPIYGSARMHQGVDMTNGRGHPIYAAHDGLVTKVHTDSGGNWTVEIDHGRNILTRYLHMDGLGAILVKEGDRVVAGEQIGRTGSSGQTTGPHLHFEVSVDGETTDPVAFLKQHGVTIK